MQASNSLPKEKFRRDYMPPKYVITRTYLDFHLEDNTRVVSSLTIKPNPNFDHSNAPLVLNGEGLELVSVSIDDEALAPSNYELDEKRLRIHTVPQQEFVLTIEVIIIPKNNTQLEGLYWSNGKYCTQCEAEGFRRITYYLDRPDVLAEFTVRITADKNDFPFLLSNGNLKSQGDEEGGRHWVEWHDPFPKPSYLFALVAGDFDLLQDNFTTKSGKEVLLEIYVDKGKLDQCHHAMESLKNAMRWDEERFGLEYDLDRYMIVAVGDFNMGAMENKGLNVFNTQYVLANSKTATDTDFDGVESVIGHEYFHNWTGNRVTCRDWFQLSLKEGLTVFRDQEFSADMGSRAAKRIDDVNVIRSIQFAEDAGPMAHPIRPDSYIEMNNFYTVTVYNKGAEVIRMIHTILGEAGFRKGMDLYFERHDGQAVTCDDFIAAMADANDANLEQFKHWYSQAGTPSLWITVNYNAADLTCTIDLEQNCPEVKGKQNQPFHIPLKLALLDEQGKELPLQLRDNQDALEEDVLHVRKERESFIFENVPEKFTPSLLRDFSAPVKIVYDISDEELAFLIAHDNNDFNRWDAAQQFMTREILRLTDSNQLQNEKVSPLLKSAYMDVLNHSSLDLTLKSQILSLPSFNSLLEKRQSINLDALIAARKYLRQVLVDDVGDAWARQYQQIVEKQEASDSRGESTSLRKIKNLVLSYGLQSANWQALEDFALKQFEAAKNMTEQLGAFAALIESPSDKTQDVIDSFYKQWKAEDLVMDKWFALQARSERYGSVAHIRELCEHPGFSIKNPNKVRSLIGAFAAGNEVHFHNNDGSGYAFLREKILEMDKINPQIASRLTSNFNRLKKFDENRQDLIRKQLREIINTKPLSNDVYEIASKAFK